MSFALRLKELRTARDMTQGELSKAVKVSQSAIAMYESGKREPKLEVMEIFADFFNVDMNYITGKSDLTTKVTESPAVPHPPLPMAKEDNDLLQAYHNADDDARQAVRFVLRDSWPKEIDQFVEKAAGPKVAKRTKDKIKESMSEGKPVILPADGKVYSTPGGFDVVRQNKHMKVIPTLSYHCKEIFRSIESEAYDDVDVKKELETYRKTLLDKSVAAFISDTINTIEERYGPIDMPRAYSIIAEEILSDDFVERYVDYGEQGAEKLIKRIRNRFR